MADSSISFYKIHADSDTIIFYIRIFYRLLALSPLLAEPDKLYLPMVHMSSEHCGGGFRHLFGNRRKLLDLIGRRSSPYSFQGIKERLRKS